MRARIERIGGASNRLGACPLAGRGGLWSARRMRKGWIAGLGLLVLAGCATAPLPGPLPVTPPVISTSGLERVLGQEARTLVTLFGEPELDVREDQARKLQFVGPICVLDAYLYPKRGAREAVVTYVDARQPDGRDIDRASCVAALVAAHRR